MVFKNLDLDMLLGAHKKKQWDSGLTEDKRIKPEYFSAPHIKPQKLQVIQAGT